MGQWGENRRRNLFIILVSFSSPIALGLYEYDTLGDESSLDFDEGDIIEVCFGFPISALCCLLCLSPLSF